MSDEITYSNTDLDLVASFDLAPLASALESRGVDSLGIFQHVEGTWVSSFETGCFGQPEDHIAALLDAIESLDPESRKLWDACSSREFNIGYECGAGPWAFNQGVSLDSIRSMGVLGIALRVTLYPERPREHPLVLNPS